MPSSMRIAELTEIGRIEYREVPMPRAGSGELVIKTRAVGLCGTDLKAFLRGHPYFKPPCVLGHEFSGTIIEVGLDVNAFAVGQQVVAAPYVECGQCELCAKNLGELCQRKAFISGALQEYILIPREIVNRATFRLPPEVDAIAGSLAEPLACVVNGIEKASIEKRDSVLVIGGGPMGALLALMARSITPRVAVSEISPARIRALQSLGLTVVDPSQRPIPAQLKEHFSSTQADKVLVAVGVGSVAEEAMNWAAPGGTVLLFGGLPKDARLTIDPFAIHYQEVSIAGSFGYRLDHFRTAVSWLNEHAAQASGLVTHTVPFEKIETGFEIARQATGLKTVVVFEESDAS
ncbi:MAG: hypothetical protein E4H08_02585 [Candidatus Atribacteria bacterium]|nr:MAG: hypothetical protein E4H08_02585 [Candidatus Atribacteria bacterium]